MNFIEYVKKLHKSISQVDFEKIDLTKINSILFSRESALLGFSLSGLKNIYRKGINDSIKSRLGPLANDINALRDFEEVKFYENSVSIYACFLLFWIIDNEVDFDDKELELISESMFVGAIGYRLLDLNQDHKILGNEAVFLAIYLINMYEQIIFEIFEHENPQAILKKYSNLYCHIEYLEKINLWKECPFNWEQSKQLGYKAGPIFSLFELIFKRKGLADDHLNSLLNGWLNLIAISQIIDDLTDVEEDLKNGFETLVMKGYYKKFGNKKIFQNSIEEFLDIGRQKTIYNNTILLFEEARNNFGKHNESLFLLLLESLNDQFNQGFVDSDSD